MNTDNRENRMAEVLPSEPPPCGTEIEMLLGSLERQRATFAWKTGNLDAAGLTATVGASTMTLGGLVKHLARCEDGMFGGKILGRGPTAPFDSPRVHCGRRLGMALGGR